MTTIKLNARAEPVVPDLAEFKQKLYPHLLALGVPQFLAVVITERYQNQLCILHNSARSILNDAFTWADSKEGSNYWVAIWSSL